MLDVELFRADMCDFRLNQQADAILCLFSSIRYAYPLERLQAAARCFAAAVRPGGVAIIEPWVAPEDFIEGRPWMDAFSTDDLKLCRTIISPARVTWPCSTFTGWRRNAAILKSSDFVDRHTMWLCPRQTMMDAFTAAGFQCRFEEDG